MKSQIKENPSSQELAALDDQILARYQVIGWDLAKDRTADRAMEYMLGDDQPTTMAQCEASVRRHGLEGYVAKLKAKTAQG